MLKNNAIFDEFSRIATSAAGSVLEFKRELDAIITAKMDAFAASRDLVSREEFEVVKQMASKAREENDNLKNELEMLRKQVQK